MQALRTTLRHWSLDAELVRRLSRGSPRADLLVNITNDGWFGERSARSLHFALGRLRAVEQGRSSFASPKPVSRAWWTLGVASLAASSQT